jgi:hypothetical protein
MRVRATPDSGAKRLPEQRLVTASPIECKGLRPERRRSVDSGERRDVMSAVLESVRRGGRAVFLLIGAVVGGVLGVAAEAFWLRRDKPKNKNAYEFLDEDRSSERL